MEVVTLGTGTLVPEANTASAALIVREGSQVLPIDLGRNALSRMVEVGVDPLALDEFAFTHLHPDHCADLVSLLFGFGYGCRPPRERPVRLVGPVGLGELVERLQSAWRWLEPSCGVEVEEIAAETRTLAGFEIETLEMHHGTTPALGYRVHSGSAGLCMAYTGDTGPGERLNALASGVDLLVAECGAYAPELAERHLGPESLADLVEASGAKALAVTHVYPWSSKEQISAVLADRLAVEFLIAADRQIIDVASPLARRHA